MLKRDGNKLEERDRVRAHEASFKMTASADGRLLATWANSSVRIWDVTGDELRDRARFDAGEPFSHLAPGPDGQVLITSASGLKLLDLRRSPPGQTALGNDYVYQCGLSRDGKAAMGWGYFGDIVLWDLARAKKTREWKLPGQILGVTLTDDRRHPFTSNGNGTVYVLRLAPTP